MQPWTGSTDVTHAIYITPQSHPWNGDVGWDLHWRCTVFVVPGVCVDVTLCCCQGNVDVSSSRSCAHWRLWRRHRGGWNTPPVCLCHEGVGKASLLPSLFTFWLRWNYLQLVLLNDDDSNDTYRRVRTIILLLISISRITFVQRVYWLFNVTLMEIMRFYLKACVTLKYLPYHALLSGLIIDNLLLYLYLFITLTNIEFYLLVWPA